MIFQFTLFAGNFRVIVCNEREIFFDALIFINIHFRKKMYNRTLMNHRFLQPFMSKHFKSIFDSGKYVISTQRLVMCDRISLWNRFLKNGNRPRKSSVYYNFKWIKNFRRAIFLDKKLLLSKLNVMCGRLPVWTNVNLNIIEEPSIESRSLKPRPKWMRFPHCREMSREMPLALPNIHMTRINYIFSPGFHPVFIRKNRISQHRKNYSSIVLFHLSARTSIEIFYTTW